MLITENDFGFIRKIKNDYTYFYTGAPTITTGHNVRVFPNPAGTETTIQIKLNEASMLWVSILNGLGQEVLVLYDGYHPGGGYPYFSRCFWSFGRYLLLQGESGR